MPDSRAQAAKEGQLLDEAIKFAHLALLRDLGPPWLEKAFPQALPGSGMLARLTRPSFLFWPPADAANVFGSKVREELVGLI